MPYALDEPIQTAGLVLTAPGGVTASYDLNVLGEGRGLTYENFIYIAFMGNVSIRLNQIYIAKNITGLIAHLIARSYSDRHFQD